MYTYTEHTCTYMDIRAGQSSLYLPCRFSQLSIEIRGDVPFPQDGPLKFTQLSMKIEKEHTYTYIDIRARPTRGAKLLGSAL